MNGSPPPWIDRRKIKPAGRAAPYTNCQITGKPLPNSSKIGMMKHGHYFGRKTCFWFSIEGCRRGLLSVEKFSISLLHNIHYEEGLAV